jgi:hypothetical protein
MKHKPARSLTWLTACTLWLALAAAVASAMVGCVSRASENTPLPSVQLTKSEFFDNCPLAVAPSSLTVVRDAATWQSLLARARVSPLPFEARATSFDQQSVLILASATTPTPSVRLRALPQALHAGTAPRHLLLDVQVDKTTPAAGELGVAVLGEPCLLMWTTRIADVDSIKARDAKTGALLATLRLP